MTGVLYLIRHTNVDISPGICYGKSDVNLAATFHNEAEIIMNKINGIPVARIYSSPLARCSKLAYKLGKKVKFDKRLEEMDFGEWECSSWTEIFHSAKGKEWFQDYLNVTCPNGESFQNLMQRVSSFVLEIPLEAKATIVVTHAGVIRSILATLKIVDTDKIFSIEICYGQIIKIENGKYSII